MATPIYLITGATGATGRAAVAALLAADQTVRAFAHREDDRSQALRKLGAEVVLGDFADPDSVKRAVRGVAAAYFCYPISKGIVEASALFAHAAKAAGVGAVVNMSQVIAREDARSHASFSHWLAERVIDWSGVPVTHLRPGFFTEWLLAFAPMIQQGVVMAPFGTGRCAFIAAEDQGRVISTILQRPDAHRGQTYPLYGPAELTFAEAAAAVGRVLGRPVGYQQIPYQAMVEGMLSRTNGLARNDALSGYAESNVPDHKGEVAVVQHLREAVEDHHRDLFAGMNDLVERITGRPPMSVEAFVERHRAAFEPASSTNGGTVPISSNEK